MVQKLSKLHGHVGKRLGGERPRPTGSVKGVGDLPWVRKGGAVAGCGHTVSVRGLGHPLHGDAGCSPAGLGQVVAAAVQAPELVRRGQGVAGSQLVEQTCGEDVLSLHTLGPQIRQDLDKEIS